ncbi:MAG: CRISPR-associated helicase Cas3' [Clostridia bacterium]|nr:CRISPR-associated helicase Cas3' [Clostridia bacterium]
MIPAKADPVGRRWLPLWLHLRDTADMMLWLYDEWLPEAEQRMLFPYEQPVDARATLTALGMLHDIGKATPVFVSHIARSGTMPELLSALERVGYPADWPREYAVPHAQAGEVLLSRAGAPDGFCSIVGAHHGKPQTEDFDPETVWINHAHLIKGRTRDGDLWPRAQDAILKWAEQTAGTSVSALPEPSQAAQALLCGLLIMADWIASNTAYFPLLPLEDDGRAVDVDRRFQTAIDRLRLPASWRTEATGDWADGIFELRFGRGEMPFVPRAAQAQTAEVAAGMAQPGILILEAPMGSGKTEAALAAAELMAARTGSGGVFFGLPTQATANALFPRLEDWAGRQSEEVRNTIILCHRMAELNPDYRSLLEGGPGDVLTGEESGLEIHSFFQGRKTALLSSFVIATVDQLLMAALCRKHVMLRQLGLAGKVVIIDEVHAYDAYMNRYLQQALRWLGEWHTPVILLSATLPVATRAALVDAYLGTPKRRRREEPWRTCIRYPLLTWTDGGQVYQRPLTPEKQHTEVRLQTIDDEDRLSLLTELLSEGGCAGVICNTVARAQSMAFEVSQRLPDAEVILCHALFTQPDRAAIEKGLIDKLGPNGRRPRRLVLVGTQVCEQSLDIDLDVLITDLAPMDLLLQRIGRLHRHPRRRPPGLSQARCYVTARRDADLENHPIYEEYLLRRTREVLPETLTLPDDIAPLVQGVYTFPEAESAEPMQRARERMETNIREKQAKAGVYLLKEPKCASAYDPATLHGLLQIEETADEVTAEASVRDSGPSVEVLLLRRAGDRSVRVPGIDHAVSLDRVPAAQEAMAIARQRLKLPWALCAPWAIDQTIAELERQTQFSAPEWGQSPWLRGELTLLLDEDGIARLNGYRLRYDEKRGLLWEKEKEGNVDGPMLQPD